ncbi:MAG: hypothetical protein A3B23_01250 [Candidatus Colwellbacteria bacterium RIFCSPLOWO2_01_FULL_48_10]|uniref:histidine kinase n=1 Tax=Candidatus Colwellbacteria bacterium RIFCSPLOWO2_01_FULL_48_10 TaxID=1797690 RepID=A0A1G1Z4W2_9BACT|nr:MAG: hypothetical protein A3B23_01250 [Candidatus Colwellbacteria bacterium RIFCSPLOWO2_01_FULL_48_10]
MLKNLTIKAKLLIYFGLLIVLAAIVGTANTYSNHQIAAKFDSISEDSVPWIQYLEKSNLAINRIARGILDISLQKLGVETTDQGTLEGKKAILLAIITDFDKAHHDYDSLGPHNSSDTSFRNQIESGTHEIKTASLEIIGLIGSNGGDQIILAKTEELSNALDDFGELIARAFENEYEEIELNHVAADALAKSFIWINAAIIFSAITLAISVGLAMRRSIVGPLKIFADTGREVARGNLEIAVKIDSKDEVGELADSFNQMTINLATLYDGLEAKVVERTRELSQLSKRNGILLQSISDAIVAIDRAWNIIEWNRAAETLTGYNRDETMGKQFRDYVHFVRERNRSENISFIEEAMLYGKVKFMDNHTFLICKDKTEIPIGNSASPIFDEEKKVIGVMVIFRDLTQEYKSQALKTDFKYASHQMRTPVTKIAWDLESALDLADGEEKKGLIQDAYESTRSIAKMVDELLELSEIDQEVVIPHYDMVNISEMIAGVFSEVDHAVKRRKLGLVYSNTSVINIETDKELLKKILVKLMDNAINYNKENGKIYLEVQEMKGALVIEIRDTGIGILEQQQPIVFTKFFRGSNFNTSNLSGAGLGLFISRAYAEVLNGKIWFKSEPDIGTSFFISIPKTRG